MSASSASGRLGGRAKLGRSDQAALACPRYQRSAPSGVTFRNTSINWPMEVTVSVAKRGGILTPSDVGARVRSSWLAAEPANWLLRSHVPGHGKWRRDGAADVEQRRRPGGGCRR